MKKIIFILILLNSVITVFGQNEKKLDLIITIDDQIQPRNTYVKFILVTSQGSDTIVANYFPGNVSLKETDYEKLISNDTKNITMNLFYQEFIKMKSNTYDYEIEIKKPWLLSSYNILKIYNLDKKKYKKLYDPLHKDKNYTFELESPNTTFYRVKEKKDS